VLLFVSSAAWTATNLRDELGDLLVAGDDDDGLAAALSLAGLGLGELVNGPADVGPAAKPHHSL
jgi:hypothetical protein